jgi:hypothetical protein
LDGAKNKTNMKFPREKFYQFCSRLVIDSKEHGQIRLKKLLGTQTYAIDEIIAGLEQGIHHFDILKARQLGITTVTLALDLFWCYMHGGMQATLAVDSEENRDMFRDTLTMYHDGLPNSHRVSMVRNNRSVMAFKNRSRIMFQIAGGRVKGGKGRGKGIIMIHATETGSWEDEESLASIIASLAEQNPYRLHIFESTAHGFNLRYDMWKNAKNAVSQKAIFIGWWRNELYRKEVGSPEYGAYWETRPSLTPQEQSWVREIKTLYDYEITAQQMAWWRWKMAESISDENLMMQEFPPHEHMAFILSGANFFSLPKIEEASNALDDMPDPMYFRLKFGDDFSDTECEETVESMADLTVWEEPQAAGYYSIGADPAYGSSDWADRFVIHVDRCYADRIVQVAEYCVTDTSTYRFAWVLVYLAGAYKNSMINLEVNGPGTAVLSEMNNLRNKITTLPREEARHLGDVIAHMQYYLYRRLDSPGGGGFVYHWKTTRDTKERMLNIFRDSFYRGESLIQSHELLEEMQIFVREDDGYLGASGKGKDDRVIAACLSCVQYRDFLQQKCRLMKLTYAGEINRREMIEEQKMRPEPTAVEAAIGNNIRNFLQRAGLQQDGKD